MWLFTTIGFFSAVQKPGTDFITIRARVRNDLDNLREKYLPDLSPTIAKAGTDYPWRATVSHVKFAEALSKIALDIDYDNFKDAVAKHQGKSRAHRYGKVWSALYDMPEEEPKKLLNWSNPVPAGKKVAYGGVVFDSKGNVLLREPKNHYDGYVWTFPKGRPDPGETPEQTALREVKEETGVDATIVGILPGDYVGGTTINRYFIMRGPDGSGFVAEDDPETAAVKWVSGDEATQYLEKTTNTTGRKRDLNVLTDAMKLVVRG
ncbi:NUDIX domain-containing protein [Dechloromonas sp. TW-R-39-2]|uniref:NUDIX domain-containing protein n=1 Tax=Dechloromonas sp. TW-R-39-2 TaxID=2654218 RepID=UPI00193D1366|nr:NUDIX hydrolase [Dechloromonas sp. TW-R-39-2]